jgi:type VI secretion system protein
LLVILFASASGCGAARNSFRESTRLHKELVMDVHVEPEANHNSPVAVDVLLVKDKDVLKSLIGMSATEWFQKRKDFERTHPKGILASSWEWVPGQEVGPVSVPKASSAKAILLFANYLTSGEHRAELPKGGQVSLKLSADDFVLGTTK